MKFLNTYKTTCLEVFLWIIVVTLFGSLGYIMYATFELCDVLMS